jgi:hypothetical protein
MISVPQVFFSIADSEMKDAMKEFTDHLENLKQAKASYLHFLQALSESRYCILGIADMGTPYTHYIPPQILLDLFTTKY